MPGSAAPTAPQPIDPATLPPGPLSPADYDRVGTRNAYIASKYDPQSWSDLALNVVTGSMGDPANVLTDAERTEHAALSQKLVDTLFPPPTPDQARLDTMLNSPLGAGAYGIANTLGASQQTQDAVLNLGAAAEGVGVAVAGARSGNATAFLGAQTGESVPIEPSSV